MLHHNLWTASCRSSFPDSSISALAGAIGPHCPMVPGLLGQLYIGFQFGLLIGSEERSLVIIIACKEQTILCRVARYTTIIIILWCND